MLVELRISCAGKQVFLSKSLFSRNQYLILLPFNVTAFLTGAILHCCHFTALPKYKKVLRNQWLHSFRAVSAGTKSSALVMLYSTESTETVLNTNTTLRACCQFYYCVLKLHDYYYYDEPGGERYLHYLTSVIEQKNTFVIWIDIMVL